MQTSCPLIASLALVSSLQLAGCATEQAVDPAAAEQAQQLQITGADYEAANALLEGNVKDLVKNASVTPHWLGDSQRFWYQRDGEQGSEYVVVDTASGNKSPAFDHSALAAALGKLLDKEVAPGALGLSRLSLSADLGSLNAVVGDKALSCQLPGYSCQLADIPQPPMGVMPSTTGKYLLQARDHNLLLVEAASGTEQQLTQDGEPYKSWGKLPDTGLMVIQLKKAGMKLPPVGAQFSPDDRYLVASLSDERAVDTVPFVEWVPTDGSLRPIVHPVRHPYTGDSKQPLNTLWAFDLASGERRQILLPEGFYFGGMDGNVLGWSEQHSQAYVVARTYGSQKLALFRADLASGEVRKLIEEMSDTRAMSNTVEYNRSNFRIINDGAEVIWYSDREGWGHLYLYDGRSGELKNAITSGDWLVQDIHALDLAKREIYFTGGARESGRDPYYRHLYRASLDGGEPVLLTAADADHSFAPDVAEMFARLFGTPPNPPVIRPDLGVFIDTYSTVATPPVTVLRSTRDGSEIATLETADASALYAAGWQAPARQAVKAADGKTDIYTVYFSPKKSLPGGKHPVIDAVYGGPQVVVAPRNFMDAVIGRNPLGRHALTRLGFAVVTTDGRGTPLRDNAFRDAGYTEFTQVGIDDHIAAIKQLAQLHPEIDAQRVGIYGWSWGGTFTAQALLSRPEFYQVGISGAGAYDYAALYPGFENVIGVPRYADGGKLRTSPEEKPANWDKLDITAMAPNLKGKLLIVYGDMDENVPQGQAFRLIDALIKANKPYDLLALPNRTHNAVQEGYVIQRHFDYFVEHLLAVEPPAGVTVAMPPVR